MNNVYKSAGIASIVLGILASIFMFTDLAQSSIISPLVIGIIGLILAILSIVLKYEKKWISIIGILLNVAPLAYFVLLFFALG